VTELEIRRLTYADLPQVVAIERRAFPAPWSLAMFVLELSKPAGICIAALEPPGEQAAPGAPDTIAGYCICSRYDTVWHLMNLAVGPERRRRGIGAQLLDALLVRLPTPDDSITLEVRRSNEAALALYEKYGFKAAGVRRRYYADNGEDALIMWRTPGTRRGSLDDVPAADPRAAIR
jgi:ribosomal-protein-alanine N-acetyltransferase